MKRTQTIVAIMAICSAMIVSCKNKQSEPAPEEIQAQKVALADSVLAEIDKLAEAFSLSSENGNLITYFELTENEKMVKPDYLLEPSFANNLVTKSQKVNALAFYLTDMLLLQAYDMPTEEVKEIVAKLAAEINHPIEIDLLTDSNMPVSEKVKKEYEGCKERGDLAYFWQFQRAIIAETAYIIDQNPELFFSKITEEQWQAFVNRQSKCIKAIRELAKYDEEMAVVFQMFNQNRVFSSEEEKASIDSSIESAKQFRIAQKDKFISRRNALIQ